MEFDPSILQIVAISGAVLGGVLATVEGWMKKRHTGVKYSVGAFFGALVASVMTSYGLVNFGSLSAEFSHSGFIGIFLSNLMIGYGADRAINAAKKAGQNAKKPIGSKIGSVPT